MGEFDTHGIFRLYSSEVLNPSESIGKVRAILIFDRLTDFPRTIEGFQGVLSGCRRIEVKHHFDDDLTAGALVSMSSIDRRSFVRNSSTHFDANLHTSIYMAIKRSFVADVSGVIR